MDSLKHGGSFTVVIESAPDRGFVATVPAVPGVVGRGETEEEALADVKTALRAAPEAFEGTTDPESLAREQSVSLSDFDELLGDFWPEEEGPEEFTAALREWRREPERLRPRAS